MSIYQKIDTQNTTDWCVNKMGQKARTAGTTKHRIRVCNKDAQLAFNDISKMTKGGRGSRSAKRKQRKQYVQDRIDRAMELANNNNDTN